MAEAASRVESRSKIWVDKVEPKKRHTTLEVSVVRPAGEACHARLETSELPDYFERPMGVALQRRK